MTAGGTGGPGEMDEVLAQIYQEFRDGLPARLDRMRSALEPLVKRFEREAVETFYRTAHSLKGTAPSFGAHEVAEVAAALAAMGRRWLDEGVAAAEDLSTSARELERLGEAADRYVASEGGEAE